MRTAAVDRIESDSRVATFLFNNHVHQDGVQRQRPSPFGVREAQAPALTPLSSMMSLARRYVKHTPRNGLRSSFTSSRSRFATCATLVVRYDQPHGAVTLSGFSCRLTPVGSRDR